MSVKESYFMTRANHLLGRNLATRISNFTNDPSEETKNVFIEGLEEIRKLKLVDAWHNDYIKETKNAGYLTMVKKDEQRRLTRPTTKVEKEEVEKRARSIKEAIEKFSKKSIL